MSINTVTVSGNLSRDSELKQIKTGHLLTGGIAVNERVKGVDGSWSDKPCFIDWALFGPRAEKLVGSLTKGIKVCITGSLTYDSWTDKQGNKRNKLSIIVREIEWFRPSNVIMDQQTAVQAAQQAPQHQQAPQYQPQPQYQQPQQYQQPIHY